MAYVDYLLSNATTTGSWILALNIIIMLVIGLGAFVLFLDMMFFASERNRIGRRNDRGKILDRMEEEIGKADLAED